jgi:hypothetical protein
MNNSSPNTGGLRISRNVRHDDISAQHVGHHKGDHQTTKSLSQKPLFCFEMTTEAAEKNFMVLKIHQFSLKKAIEAQAGSPAEYGSEFRKPEILKPLLGNHCLWPCMKNILLHGSQWLLTPIT